MQQQQHDNNTVLLLTSRTVTQQQKIDWLHQIIQIPLTGVLQLPSSTTSSTTSTKNTQIPHCILHQSCCWTIPTTIQEAMDMTQTFLSCHASALFPTIVYFPSVVDLQRQEALLTTLGPVLQQIILNHNNNDSTTTPKLLVVVPPSWQSTQVQQILEHALADASIQNPSILDNIHYVHPSNLLSTLHNNDPNTTTQYHPNMIQSTPTKSWTTTTNMRMMMMKSPVALATARQAGPKAQAILQDSLLLLRQACEKNPNDNDTPLPFGALVDALLQRATQEYGQKDARITTTPHAPLQRQMLDHLQNQFLLECESLFHQQLRLLQERTFATCQKELNKLLISPNLKQDMKNVADRSVQEFQTKATNELLPQKAHGWSVAPAVHKYTRQVQEFCQNRWTAAEASGQFKPLPRKGVTVGLHWLLPKPFGNDFRQEPWKVHATDGMVYVPRGKVSNVNAEDVRTGDWRDKVVPSPIGNDIVYMQ